MAMMAGRDRWTRSESLWGVRGSVRTRGWVMDQRSVRQAGRRAASDAQAARCQECPSVDLRRLEGLAFECGAGDLAAAHSAKISAILVPRSVLPGSAKLTDRPGIVLTSL